MSHALSKIVLCLLALTGCATTGDTRPDVPEGLGVHYLEIVTPEVDAICASLESVHGVTFSEPQAHLGGARTAALESGGRIGVRAPMHAMEKPVVRIYARTDDIVAATQAAGEAGGQIAMLPTAIGDEGRFSIYLQGGIEFGLWQP